MPYIEPEMRTKSVKSCEFSRRSSGFICMMEYGRTSVVAAGSGYNLISLHRGQKTSLKVENLAQSVK